MILTHNKKNLWEKKNDPSNSPDFLFLKIENFARFLQQVPPAG
jgi:hypothetical protein